MSNDPIPTYKQMSALAELVRGGTLSAEQREQLVKVFDTIGHSARAVVQLCGQTDDPARHANFTSGVWSDVAEGYTRLVEAVAPGA